MVAHVGGLTITVLKNHLFVILVGKIICDKKYNKNNYE